MRRLLLALILVVSVSVGLTPGLEASEQWCSSDPVEIFITSNGVIVPVFVVSSAQGLDHLVTVQLAQISATTSSTGNGTSVKMTVVVWNDLFGSNYPTASVVSLGLLGTGPILAQTTGSSGHPMTMNFTLPAP